MDRTASAILLWGVKEFAQVSQLEKSELFEALLSRRKKKTPEPAKRATERTLG